MRVRMHHEPKLQICRGVQGTFATETRRSVRQGDDRCPKGAPHGFPQLRRVLQQLQRQQHLPCRCSEALLISVMVRQCETPRLAGLRRVPHQLQHISLADMFMQEMRKIVKSQVGGYEVNSSEVDVSVQLLCSGWITILEHTL